MSEAKQPKPRSRKKTTGRYSSRAELCDTVWNLYMNTPMKLSHVARFVGVSETVVRKILDTKEGRPAAAVSS